MNNCNPCNDCAKASDVYRCGNLQLATDVEAGTYLVALENNTTGAMMYREKTLTTTGELIINTGMLAPNHTYTVQILQGIDDAGLFGEHSCVRFTVLNAVGDVPETQILTYA